MTGTSPELALATYAMHSGATREACWAAAERVLRESPDATAREQAEAVWAIVAVDVY